MKKCNGPDMESRKGWFTLFPSNPPFCKVLFLYLLWGGVGANLKTERCGTEVFKVWKEPIRQ